MLPSMSLRRDPTLGLPPPGNCPAPRCSDPTRQESSDSLIAQMSEYGEVGPLCSKARPMPMPLPLEQFVGETIIYCLKREDN